MVELNFSLHLKCGSTRRKTEDLWMSFGNIRKHKEHDYWMYDVVVKGKLNLEEEEQIAHSEFNCVVLGTAFLRQILRSIKNENQKIKYYYEAEGELDEVSIEEIFWVHDCVQD